MNKFSNERVKGFLHIDGQKFVNGDGEQIILRGWGTGNWTNPEGFMVGGPDSIRLTAENYNPVWFDRGRSMEAAIRELCGTEYAESFWPKWYRNHLGEADIKAMANLGYNSVRLVLSARAFLLEEPGITFNEDSFAMLDEILNWCEKYKVYAILDLHGAPGGQSALAIDDGIDSVPHLFVDEESFERGLTLWEEFAVRYKDRWIVGGYDLLNEPLCMPEWQHLLPKLIAFYDKAIERIRKHDKKHLFTIEGMSMATDLRVFCKDYDPECHNWCIHLHFYGFAPEVASLYPYLSLAAKYNVPIWMGEGSLPPADCAVFLDMASEYGIGWNRWCWKVAENPERNTSRGVSYKLPDGWDEMKAFFAGGPKPGYLKSQAVFDQLLANIRYENCIPSVETGNYQLRRPDIDLPAVGYDHNTVSGITYSGDWEFGNICSYRSADKMKMVLRPQVEMPARMPAAYISPEEMKRGRRMRPKGPLELLMLELRKGEFTVYTIRDVVRPCSLTLELTTQEDATLEVKVTDHVLSVLEVSTKSALHDVFAGIIPEGEAQTIQLTALCGSIGIATLRFRY